jgi:hypothetical protein
LIVLDLDSVVSGGILCFQNGESMIRKWLAIGIILLFLGVTIAPTINFNTVKASQDDDLVEVTTQACGIQGYGNTTVKLTREQYQNLEQYLVEFRARLNQTTTREEAVPIFKDAVVELDKYGLLPEGISVKYTQKLVTGLYQHQNIIRHLKTLLPHQLSTQEDNGNIFCLIAGYTDHTTFENPGGLFFNWLYRYSDNILLLGIGLYMYFFLTVFCWINPFAMSNRISLSHNGGVPSDGWVTTIGLLGIKKFQGNMRGALPIDGTRWSMGGPSGDTSKKYPAAVGFVGLKIGISTDDVFEDLITGKFFMYLGSAIWTEISTFN